MLDSPVTETVSKGRGIIMLRAATKLPRVGFQPHLHARCCNNRAKWEALASKELKGKPSETLIRESPEGIKVFVAISHC